MGFLKKHGVSLQQLLLSPLVLRETLPLLAKAPRVGAALLRELADAFGHRPGAIRTALSRLRAAGALETIDGEARYRLGSVGHSVSSAVARRAARDGGYVLAVFSFATDDARERHLVREALRLHGFMKLAQNVYVTGPIETAGVEAALARHGLAAHVYLFRCSDEPDPALDRRLVALFRVEQRARVLARFADELDAFLTEKGLTDRELAQRFIAAAPAHFQVTFVDEPPLPKRVLPRGYPLERLLTFGEVTGRRARALERYFGVPR